MRYCHTAECLGRQSLRRMERGRPCRKGNLNSEMGSGSMTGCSAHPHFGYFGFASH